MGCGNIDIIENKKITQVDLSQLTNKENNNEKLNHKKNPDQNYDYSSNCSNFSFEDTYANFKKAKEYYDNFQNLETFQNIMYNKHLELRDLHGCSKAEFKMDEKLNEIAQDYIKKLIECESKSNEFGFNSYTYLKEPLGENIYISKEILNPEQICEKWYNERIYYQYDKKKFQKEACHFTQLIWKNTKKVGFAFGNKNNKIYAVAFYYPAGNIFSEFGNNVGKKVKK